MRRRRWVNDPPTPACPNGCDADPSDMPGGVHHCPPAAPPGAATNSSQQEGPTDDDSPGNAETPVDEPRDLREELEDLAGRAWPWSRRCSTPPRPCWSPHEHPGSSRSACWVRRCASPWRAAIRRLLTRPVCRCLRRRLGRTATRLESGICNPTSACRWSTTNPAKTGTSTSVVLKNGQTFSSSRAAGGGASALAWTPGLHAACRWSTSAPA